MVKAEFDLHPSSDPVYKMIGPILIKQDLDEAQQTVQKRLEFIRGEKEKLESKIKSKEQQGSDLKLKINQMQAQLQTVTMEAMNAIKQQHQQQKAGGA